ncbi:MAG: SurA N-terminal domain-containing protein [Patescibacteria group bacterium]|nr:SurA N-terminal domain-containing protein [Patescibacteria group bacterium]
MTKDTKKIIIIAIAAIILIKALTAIGIYGFRSTNAFYCFMTRALPYPAMFVNYHPVLYREYADNVNTLRNIAREQGGSEMTEGQIRKSAAERLVANQVLEQMAAERKIKAFDYEIEKEFQRAVGDTDQDELEMNLKKLFGWTAEEYKENVVKPFILGQKLTEAIYGSNADDFEKYLQEEIKTAKILYLVPH